MDILALILARGGSKGIPRKNLLPLRGKPMIAYSIEHARASKHITRVIVSTDDPEIAAVAREHGAETPFLRPAEFARDASVDFEAFHHALTWLGEHENYRPEIVVQLRPPGPVRKVALVDAAIETLLADPAADSVKSVRRPTESPYKMWGMEGRYLRPLLALPGVAEAHTLPRQMLPPVFWQSGYVDVIRSRTILEQKLMYGRVVLPFLVEEIIYEIDYLEDIPQVERALAALEGGELHDGPPSGAERHSV